MKISTVFGKLEQQEIEDLIRKQFVARLACHSKGVTYVIPMSYAYDGTYFYCRSFDGQKIKMLRENPDVCLELDDTRNLANWKSVICYGRFEELTEGPDRQDAIQKLSDRVLPILSSQTMHISPEWPFPAGDTKDIKGILFRIKIEKRSGRYERSDTEAFYAT